MTIEQMTFTARQEEILTEALKILAEEGSKALTMKRVAHRIGFTEAAMYRHFENKHAMLLALYSFVRQSLLGTLSPILALECSPPERLKLFVAKAIDFLVANRGVNLVLLAESIQQKDVELREAMLAIFMGFKSLVENLLQVGIATGHFRDDIDTDIYATCIAGTIQGALTRYVLAGYDPKLFDLIKGTDTLIQFLTEGIFAVKGAQKVRNNE